MSKKEHPKDIRMMPTIGMGEEALAIFDSMRNTHGLAEKIVTILMAYAHEKGLKTVNINTLYGHAMVSESQHKEGEQ